MLTVDVGGSHAKVMTDAGRTKREFSSDPDLSAKARVAVVSRSRVVRRFANLVCVAAAQHDVLGLQRLGLRRLGYNFHLMDMAAACAPQRPVLEPVSRRGDPLDLGRAMFSDQGKEAVVAALGPDQFFGEGCLNGQTVRIATAIAMEESLIASITKTAMTAVLENEPKFSQMFMAYLLSRNSRVEEDLIDQLFNSTEKRLARLLLLLANFGKEGNPQPIEPSSRLAPTMDFPRAVSQKRTIILRALDRPHGCGLPSGRAPVR